MAKEMEDLQYALRHYWRQYRGAIILVAVVLVVLWAAGSMFYKVGADSRGVVLRLGKPLEPTPPGLHMKAPWPIDVVYTVPVEKVQSLELGYRTVEAGRRTRYAPTGDDQRTMARMLTADLNLAHVEWVVQYRIGDANQYLFKIGGERGESPLKNARDLISDTAEAVMRQIVGDVSVDSVITIGREKIAADAKVEMQKMLDSFESGITVVAVKLQSATPPEPVKDAFDEVNRAKQMKEKKVNDAKGKRNAQIPRARGQRDRMIAEAEGYALRVTMTAEGQANAFLSRLAEYDKAREITKVRLYLEAMEEIFAQVEEKIIIDESVTGLLPLLHLNAGGGGVAQGGSVRGGRKGGVR
jgi:membrane protease subunit HflK